MSDSLAIYPHDHLAGSNFAVELLEFLRDQHPRQPLGDAAAALLAEVEADRTVLQGIIARVGHGVPFFKEASAWVAEKLSELKLRRGDFGTFEALEALALGILGKLALWRALAVIAENDAPFARRGFQPSRRSRGAACASRTASSASGPRWLIRIPLPRVGNRLYHA
jgi:hypothetical protein